MFILIALKQNNDKQNNQKKQNYCWAIRIDYFFLMLALLISD